MIRFFTRHPTAANLLMAAFLIAGALSAPRILRETQPHFAPSEVEIHIRYAGATAQEVEEVIGRRVEDAIDGISFVKEIRVDAREGMAAIVVEMDVKGDIQTFLRDIETGIDSIDDFPPQVEAPVITELGRTETPMFSTIRIQTVLKMDPMWPPSPLICSPPNNDLAASTNILPSGEAKLEACPMY